MKIEGVVCICSRGLLHSKMMESVDWEIQLQTSAVWKREYTHDQPIPEAQNDVTERALKRRPEYLWFVEEDIVVPRGTLQTLMEANAHIAVATYKLPGGQMSHRMHREERSKSLAYAGLGCTLIHRSCFGKLEKPYWRTDLAFSPSGEPSRYDWPYGGQDIQFFMRAREEGLKSQFVDIECDHLYVEEYGEPKTNNGCHVIRSH